MLGRTQILVQVCLEVEATRKNSKIQLAQCLLLSKDGFLMLFIDLKLVELIGSVGCCVEMGCVISTC